MKECGGIWLPDREQHLVEHMRMVGCVVEGRLTYQYHKLLAGMPYVRQWRTALDVGAHVGLWSMHLAKRFTKVIAFEPDAEHRACFKRNIYNGSSAHVALVGVALGDKASKASLGFEEGSSGGTHLIEGNDVEVWPLDYFSFEEVDFVKIDVEGYELFVVQGGERTIRTHRPVMVVEQKPKGLAERYGKKQRDAVDQLLKWGAKVRKEISGDVILSWD
jgi:FkbM family methyltransferase